MDKTTIGGVKIAYEVRGDGETVLLIHGACIADALRPLGDRLEGYRVIRYHRRGYGGSGGAPPADVAVHAADALALLEHLGAAPAHVIGHSYGGATALQLASDAPAALRSLVLLEPALPAQIPSAAIIGDALAVIGSGFGEGKPDEATDGFLRTVLGPDWQALVRKNLSSGAIAQVFADGDDLFAGDLASFETWAYGAEQAARITCPVLLVLGAESDRTVRDAFTSFGIEHHGAGCFEEMVAVARSWLPRAELVTLPGVNHALQMQDAAAVAAAVEPFLARHRVAA
jgi:pimeloyl-ACP methyl ester carboxylesterase